MYLLELSAGVHNGFNLSWCPQMVTRCLFFGYAEAVNQSIRSIKLDARVFWWPRRLCCVN